MKVRLDFVTNSSSTSSAVALGSSILGIIGGLGLTSCQCSDPGGGGDDDGGSSGDLGPSMEDATISSALEASEQAAREAADKMAADAAAKDQLINNVLASEDQKLDATAQKMQGEIDKYTQQWQDAQQGVDPKDPGYADFKKQYDDYIDYVKSQLDQVRAQQYEIQVAEAQEQIAQESRSGWVKQQQEDLVQVMEQKSFLEAVSRGYGKDKNYDISSVQDRLNQLNQREQDLKNTLKQNSAEIDYTPRDRGEIGPDPEMARINREYKLKQQQLQEQIKAEKAARDKVKRAQLEKEQEWLEKDMVTQNRRATFWNVMTKAAETTQVVADVGVDVLSNVTGPIGKTIKTCYTGLKPLAGGFGEGMVKSDMINNINKDGMKGFWDSMKSQDMGKSLVKGGVSGLSDIAKDKIGGIDKYGKPLQNIYTIGSEAGKSMLDSALDGKTGAQDLVKAGLSGAAKGSLDVSVNVITDHVLPAGADMPEGMDWSDINVKNFVNSVKSSNPLTVRNLGREALGNSLKSAGIDQAKNFIKGDDVIYSGWNQSFTGDVIDKGTSLGAPKYTPKIINGLNSVGNAAKTTGGIIKEMVTGGGGIPVMR